MIIYFLSQASLVAQTVRNLPVMQETGFDPWVRKISWRRSWQPTPVFLPGESHGYRRLAGSVQSSHSVVSDSAPPWNALYQNSLSISNSCSLLKLMSMESVMPSNHLILCHALLLPPSIFPSIRVFSNKSVLLIRGPKYWVSASASVLPMNTQDWFPLGWIGLISLQFNNHV